MQKEKTFTQLFIPIFAETLFFMMAGMADTLMLSSVGDQAVGAVGTVNTYLSMFILMFSIISTGMMAVITQNIGAGRPGTARQVRNIGLICNLVMGSVISLLMGFFSRPFLITVGISPALEELAAVYFSIVGGTCFLNAMIPVFSGYLRAFGYTKHSLWAAVTGNLVNVALNALFLFYCHWGVAGVAAATAVSKLVNLILVVIPSFLLVRAGKASDRSDSGKLFRQILRIGVPSALENMLYNIALTIAISFLNRMDSEGFQVAARAYAAQITGFYIALSADECCRAVGMALRWRSGKWRGKRLV